MGSQGTKQEKSVEELLDLTIAVIAEEGLAGCSFRTLADRAKTSTSTFTYRFGTRLNLLRETLRRIYTLGGELIRLDDLDHPDPVVRLFEIGLDDLQLGSGFEPYKQAYMEMLVVAPRDPELMDAIREQDEVYRRPYFDLIVRAQEQGLIDPELDPNQMTIMIWANINGLNTFRYAYPDQIGPEELEYYFRRIFEGIIGHPVGGG